MWQFELGKTYQKEENGDSAQSQKLIVWPVLKAQFYKRFGPCPISYQGKHRPWQKDPQKCMEKEEEIAAVLADALSAHTLKALFPKNKKDTTPIILSPNHFFWMKVKLMVIGIEYR